MNTIQNKSSGPTSNAQFDSNTDDSSINFPLSSYTSSTSVPSCISCPYYVCTDQSDSVFSADSVQPPIKILISPPCAIPERIITGLTQGQFDPSFSNIPNQSNSTTSKEGTCVGMSLNRNTNNNINTTATSSSAVSIISTSATDSTLSPSLPSSYSNASQNTIMSSSPDFISTQYTTPISFHNTSFPPPQTTIMYSPIGYPNPSIHSSISNFTSTKFNPTNLSTLSNPSSSAINTSNSASFSSAPTFPPSPPSTSSSSSSSSLSLSSNSTSSSSQLNPCASSSSQFTHQPCFFADPSYHIESPALSLISQPNFVSPPSTAPSYFPESDAQMFSSSFSTPPSFSSNEFTYLPNPSCQVLEEKNLDSNLLQCQHCWKELKALQFVCRHHELEIERLQNLAGKYLERYKSLLSLTSIKDPSYDEPSDNGGCNIHGEENADEKRRTNNYDSTPNSWKTHILELHEGLTRSEAQVSLLSHQVYLLSNELHQSNERMTETARQLRAFERQMLEKGLR